MEDKDKVEAVLKEYEEINKLHLHVYTLYTKCLIFAVVALGAVCSFIIPIYMNDSNKCMPIIGMISIFIMFLINTWVAGWAFLNVEIWSYRYYLARLEQYLDSFIEGKSFNFYRTGYLGFYRNITNKHPLSPHNLLNYIYAFSLFIVYMIAICTAYEYGFEKLSTFFGSKYHAFITSFGTKITIPAISFALLIFTVVIKLRIQKNQRKYINMSHNEILDDFEIK